VVIDLSASEELERIALKHATEATQLDQQGSRGLAIAKYQRAVDVLLQLCALYPKSSQNLVLMEHVESYRKRIKELQNQANHHEPIESAQSGGEAKFEHLVLNEKPDVKWVDIANLSEAKNAIEESIIWPVRRPDLFPLGWPRGILFFGPSGCGKTLLAAAAATEIDATFFCVDASSIMSKWLGESEKNVAQLFAEARRVSTNGKAAIIFIDEIDSLIGVRSQEVGGEIRTRNQFLKEMDGLIDKKKVLHTYVIGATNKPWALDEPFRRRFQKRILVPLPEESARLEMFKIFSKKLNLGADLDLVELAKITDGHSGSDILNNFQAAQSRVVREFFENGNPDDRQAKTRPIMMQDFRDVFRVRKPSVDQRTIRSYKEWSEQFQAA
jgi:SpoVK/Ycf46/Vps4 family AAA+-type ATPase